MMTQPITHLLLYAFQPFGKYATNITEEILYLLPSYPSLTTVVLPVDFEPERWQHLVTRLQPSHVLGLGQCARGQQIRVERRAFNQMKDRSCGLEQPIETDGPATLSTTWHLPFLSGFTLSYDAGRYVCNYSMWQMTRLSEQWQMPYAFLHIPRTLPLQTACGAIQHLLSRLGLQAD